MTDEMLSELAKDIFWELIDWEKGFNSGFEWTLSKLQQVRREAMEESAKICEDQILGRNSPYLFHVQCAAKIREAAKK